MHRVGFKHTVPVFERTKTFYTSDSVATVIDMMVVYIHEQVKMIF